MGGNEQRIKELVLSKVGKCGQCGGTYEMADINILGHKDDLWFLMLVCSSCHQAVGVAAVVKEHAKRQIGEQEEPVAQLPAGRLERSVGGSEQSSSPVTAGDVDALHEFLKVFNGDFKRLFGERV